MPLADCHSHLDRYSDEVLERVLARCQQAGLALVLTAGTDAASSARCLELAERYALVEACVGIHPLHAASESEWPSLERLAARARIISEAGLDFSPGAPDHDLQRELLRRHLALRKPAILHLVGSDEIPAVHAPAVVHYFQGNARMAVRYLDAGLLISVGKPVLQDAELRDAVRFIPLERLLIETDSYPLPGRTTEPSDVLLVAQAVAAARSEPLDDIIEATWTNLSGLLGHSVRAC